MDRTIDINSKNNLNRWVARSIELFESTPYLDNILKIYPLSISAPIRLSSKIRRAIIIAHQSRNTKELLKILSSLNKFPYDDPIWYMLKNIEGCLDNNPFQIERIAKSLYSMTAEETVVRLEAAPKLNTQIGPMFNSWLRQSFALKSIEEFQKSEKGICILDASEESGKAFLMDELNQSLSKRPDLVAKCNSIYIIGEAKWIGQPGGNQEKQVQEVLNFCKNQRGEVRRIGIIDGFPWAVKTIKGKIIYNKEAVLIQESEYDIMSALLLKEYFEQY